MDAPIYFHVSSSLNRVSIQKHGLDWKRMAAARGIAGSRKAEQEGCFVCLDHMEVRWFVRMNNTGGPVDVWTVRGVDPTELVISPEGHSFVPRPVPPESLELTTENVPAARRDAGPTPPGDHDVPDASTGLSFEL